MQWFPLFSLSSPSASHASSLLVPSSQPLQILILIHRAQLPKAAKEGDPGITMSANRSGAEHNDKEILFPNGATSNVPRRNTTCLGAGARTSAEGDSKVDYLPSQGRNRRWISRSGSTMIAKAQCALKHPKPVRADEVKRLVSLCRDKDEMPSVVAGDALLCSTILVSTLDIASLMSRRTWALGLT